MKFPKQVDLYDFLARWAKAQKAKDIEAMEEMLTLPYLNYWWWALRELHLHPQVKNNIMSCIERTLVKASFIADSPERPSERAMRLAEKEWSSKV